MMNPKDQIPGEEEYLYTRIRDMKCCLHSCSVWECPEAVCIEDFPALSGWRGGKTAYLRYQEAHKIFSQYKDINEAAKVMGIDPSNARKRLKWYQSVNEAMQCLSMT